MEVVDCRKLHQLFLISFLSLSSQPCSSFFVQLLRQFFLMTLTLLFWCQLSLNNTCQRDTPSHRQQHSPATEPDICIASSHWLLTCYRQCPICRPAAHYRQHWTYSWKEFAATNEFTDYNIISIIIILISPVMHQKFMAKVIWLSTSL